MNKAAYFLGSSIFALAAAIFFAGHAMTSSSADAKDVLDRYPAALAETSRAVKDMERANKALGKNIAVAKGIITAAEDLNVRAAKEMAREVAKELSASDFPPSKLGGADPGKSSNENEQE